MFLRHEYMHILFAYDCVVVVAVVVGRYFFVHPLFFLYYFLKFPFLLVVVFLLLLLLLLFFFFSMLLSWLTGFVFTLKLVHHVIFYTCDVIGRFICFITKYIQCEGKSSKKPTYGLIE